MKLQRSSTSPRGSTIVPAVRLRDIMKRKLLIFSFLFFVMICGCASATVNVYPVTAISDTKILPATDMSGYTQSNTVNIQASPGEITCGSFVINSDSQLTNLITNVSNVSGDNGIIQASNVDLKYVKCWWQAGYNDINYFPTGNRYLTPELLLHDDSLINATNDMWSDPHASNSNGNNYIKLTNGTYVNISDSTPKTGALIVPISSRPIQDADSIQPINLSANYNKQIWITINITNNTTPGIYKGKITLSTGVVVLKSLDLNIIVLPLSLPSPNIEYSMFYQGQLTPTGSISSLDKTLQQYMAEQVNMHRHGVTTPSFYNWENDDILQQELQLRLNAGLNLSNFYHTQMQGTTADAQYIYKYKNLTAPYGVKNWYEYGPDEANINNPTDRAKIALIHNAGGKYFAAQSVGYDNDPTQMADVLDFADVYGPLSKSLAALYHSNGHRVFSYSNPQIIPEYPRLFRQNYGLLLWQNDYDGAMDYIYQGSVGDIWDDFDGISRDFTFTYPTQNGVIDTVQWEGFREGVNDMRYLAALQAAIAANPNCKTASDARAYLNKLKISYLPDTNIDTARHQIANYSLSLQSDDPLLTVNFGSGSGFYLTGQNITITANPAPVDGMYFSHWVGDTKYLNNSSSAIANVTIPETAVTVSAIYSAAIYDSNFSCRKIIKIDHAMVSNVSQNNFSYVYSTTDPDLRNISNGGYVVNANGSDVSYTLPNGTLLSDEKEYYNSSTGNLVNWIKIPTLSSTTDTYIIQNIGNKNITRQQSNSSAVWDSNYIGVWHGSNFNDSTINHNNNTNTVSPPSSITGKIDGAMSFDGTSQYIDVGNTASEQITGPMTIEMWFNSTGWGNWDNWQWLVCKNSNSVANTGFTIGKSGDLHKLDFAIGGRVSSPVDEIITPNALHKLDCVFIPSVSMDIYVDGQKLPNTVDGPVPTSITTNTEHLFFGKSAYYDGFSGGMFDEIRISNISRSSDTLVTEFRNQYNPATYYEVGSLQAKPISNFTTSNVLNSANISFTDTSSGSPTSWLWDFGDGNTSTEQNPTHVYYSGTKWIVNLTTANEFGSNTTLVTKNASDFIDLSFNGSPIIGFAPLKTQFTDTSNIGLHSCLWDFGDSSTSTQQNPVHIYSQPGIYTVNLTVTTARWTFSTQKIITVYPNTNFHTNATYGVTPLNISFIDDTKNDTSELWSLGDGNTSTSKNPVNTYYTAGWYPVSLNATNTKNGLSVSYNLTKTQYIYVASSGSDAYYQWLNFLQWIRGW